MQITMLVSSLLFVLFVKKGKKVLHPQISEGGTKESRITAECKHDGAETSGFASVASIVGVTQVLLAGADGGAFVMMTGGVASAGQFCINVKNAAAVM